MLICHVPLNQDKRKKKGKYWGRRAKHNNGQVALKRMLDRLIRRIDW